MSASMIEQSAARLFAENVDKSLLERFESGQWPAKLWSLVEDNGLTLALASEVSGGIAASWAECYPIFRGLGYWQVPVPLADTMIAALLLSRAGLEVPNGPIALIDESQIAELKLGSDGTLSGKASNIAWARYCRSALISFPDRLVLVDLRPIQGPPGSGIATLTQYHNAAHEPVDALGFANVPCSAKAEQPFQGLANPLRTLAALGRSAMMVGAMEWLLEQSVQYAKDRVQFGRPIGRNQAIQQSLALMTGEVACARMAAQIGFADAPGVDAERFACTHFSTAVAKIRTGEAATRCAAIAHQVHGAIGFTYEHALNFATRRLWAWREAHGSDTWWAQKLGEAAIEAGADGFWPGITERQFRT
jgi:acyl-CoA dehydrogenase